MAISNSIENFAPITNEAFVNKANRLRPELIHIDVIPSRVSLPRRYAFRYMEIFVKDKNAELLKRLARENPSVGMVTPYAYHHYIEALIKSGMLKEAMDNMKMYWGAMVEDGADCFFELYDPKNKKVSPYGSRIINSYCRAWSSTPSYFIRKYFAR